MVDMINVANCGAVDGLVVSVANGELANTNTSYTYFNMMREGFYYFSIDHIIQATTITLEFTNDDQDTADGDARWVDLTSAITGAATITASGTVTVTIPWNWARGRIKRLTTNATNAFSARISRGR